MNTFIWPRQSADCPALMDTVSPPPHHISLHNKHGCQNQTKWNQFILYSECMLNEINVLWGSVAAEVVYYFWIHDGFRAYRGSTVCGKSKQTQLEILLTEFEELSMRVTENTSSMFWCIIRECVFQLRLKEKARLLQIKHPFKDYYLKWKKNRT